MPLVTVRPGDEESGEPHGDCARHHAHLGSDRQREQARTARQAHGCLRGDGAAPEQPVGDEAGRLMTKKRNSFIGKFSYYLVIL